MARISNEQIIEIRNSVSIVDIISEYIPLVQKGKQYFCVCPFHDDHNPSMSVDPTRQIYKCFVCGAGGNVFTFLMEYEHVTFMEAVKKVADKVHINIDIGTSYKKNNQLDKFYEMYDLALKFYRNSLLTSNGVEARSYLQSRDINEDIVKEFDIGLSLTGDKLYKTLISSGFEDKDIMKSGLCNANEKGYYDTFSRRIMFPLWDVDGKPVAFSGRIYNTEDSSKYVNSKESPIFIKGHMLYNYHRAKESIRKEGQVIIVEGFMDVIALHKVGIKNVIATMGTAITPDQAHLIKRLSPNVILMFDGDKAGNKATIACSEELLKLGIIPKIVRLEDNLDPDEYINTYGLEKLKYHLDNPISLIDYKMDIYKTGKNLHNSEDISNYINEVIKEVNLVKDKIVAEVAIQKLSKETGVSTDTISSLLTKEDKIKDQVLPHPVKKEIKIANKYQEAYERLLFYMLRHKEVIRLVDESDVFIPSQEYRYLSCEIISFYKKYERIDIADFMAYLEDKKELLNTLNKVTYLSLPENYIREEIDDYIKVLNDYTVSLEIKRLEELIKNTNNEIDKANIANQIVELKKGVDTNGFN